MYCGGGRYEVCPVSWLLKVSRMGCFDGLLLIYFPNDISEFSLGNYILYFLLCTAITNVYQFFGSTDAVGV